MTRRPLLNPKGVFSLIDKNSKKQRFKTTSSLAKRHCFAKSIFSSKPHRFVDFVAALPRSKKATWLINIRPGRNECLLRIIIEHMRLIRAEQNHVRASAACGLHCSFLVGKLASRGNVVQGTGRRVETAPRSHLITVVNNGLVLLRIM